MMMAIAKKMGRPTCWHAANVTSQVSAEVSRPPFFLLRVLAVSDDVFRDDDGRVHQHADGDGDAGE
jgi:hypothetical protein